MQVKSSPRTINPRLTSLRTTSRKRFNRRRTATTNRPPDAAGPRLLDECRLLGGCRTGDAKLTRGYELPVRFIIHTVGPVWHGGTRGEPELLASCYRRCIEVATQNGIRTLAFPGIGTGIYGYPVELAAKVAIATVRTAVTGFPLIREAVFCCHSAADLAVYQALLADAAS